MVKHEAASSILGLILCAWKWSLIENEIVMKSIVYVTAANKTESQIVKVTEYCHKILLLLCLHIMCSSCMSYCSCCFKLGGGYTTVSSTVKWSGTGWAALTFALTKNQYAQVVQSLGLMVACSETFSRLTIATSRCRANEVVKQVEFIFSQQLRLL